MPHLAVEKLTFTFPSDWVASKYDDWAYYRNQFSRQGNELAAMDLIAVSPSRDAYLIEVKDYRHPGTERPSGLPDALANKVFCTLAALMPASVRAAGDERKISRKFLRCNGLSVVFHIEQPKAHKPVVDLADLKQRLKARLRAVDPHLKFTSIASMGNVAWSVS